MGAFNLIQFSEKNKFFYIFCVKLNTILATCIKTGIGYPQLPDII